MKYIINSVQDSAVNVSFMLDGGGQLDVNLNNMPTYDAEALDRALSDYALEYQAKRSTVDAVVLTKVGVEQDVKAAVLVITEAVAEDAGGK